MLEGAARSGRPRLLLASWPGPTVVLGYGQPVEDVALEACRRLGMPVLRRLTGGTGVVHHGDLGVSLALPAAHPWADGIVGLYGRFLDVLAPALRAAGAPVERLAVPARASRVRSPICFEDQLADTLVIGGRKVVGCAQVRRRGAVLVHAAVLCGLDPDRYAAVFRVEPERVRRALAPALDPSRRRAAGDLVVEGLAAALAGEPVEVGEPRPGPEHLAPYATFRWQPLALEPQGRSATEE